MIWCQLHVCVLQAITVVAMHAANLPWHGNRDSLNGWLYRTEVYYMHYTSDLEYISVATYEQQRNPSCKDIIYIYYQELIIVVSS